MTIIRSLTLETIKSENVLAVHHFEQSISTVTSMASGDGDFQGKLGAVDLKFQLLTD